MAKKTTTPDIVRPLRNIASEIWRKWDRPYFGAVPYLEAMQRLRAIWVAAGNMIADEI